MNLTLLKFCLLFVFTSGCASQTSNYKLTRHWVRGTSPISYLGDYTGSPIQPLPYKNLILTANNIDSLSAYTKLLGLKKWKLDLTGGVSSPLLLVSDFLFFSSYDGFAYSVSAATGKVNWKKDIQYPSLQNFLYEDGRIYIQNQNSEILVLEASSGEVIWNFSKKSNRKITVGALGNFISLGSLIIAGLPNGEVVALEKSSGKIRWQRKLNFNSRFRDIKTLLLFDTDKLLVAGYDDHIYSLEAVNGTLKWKRKFSVVTNFLNMKPEEVCFGSADLTIKCINPIIGSELKSIKRRSLTGQLTKISSTKVAYGLSQGGLEILDLETKKSILYPTSSGIHHPPFWNEKKSEIYFNSNAGNVYYLSLKKDYD